MVVCFLLYVEVIDDVVRVEVLLIVLCEGCDLV